MFCQVFFYASTFLNTFGMTKRVLAGIPGGKRCQVEKSKPAFSETALLKGKEAGGQALPLFSPSK